MYTHPQFSLYIYAVLFPCKPSMPASVHSVVVNAVVYPGILFRGVQQIQLRTEDREKGDLGAVAP